MKLGPVITHLFHPQRSNNHRPRVLHPEAVAYLSLIVLGFLSLSQVIGTVLAPSQSILGFASNITPLQVIEQTNKEREKAGLSPLTLNPQLTVAATSKGQDMMADQYWAHVAPDGKGPWAFMREAGYVYRVAGENLARDFSNTGDMVQAWMASPTHRANIMNSRYKEIGVAVIDGSLQGYETTLVVQMFGTPQLQAADIPSAGVETQPQEVVAIAAQPPDAGSQVVISQSQTLGQAEPVVLASALVPGGQLELPPLFTPLQISKAFFLSMIMMVIGTLIYDSFIIGNRDTVRMVGQNLAHVMFLSVIAFLVIFFKGGIIG